MESVLSRWVNKFKRRGKVRNPSKGTEKIKKVMKIAYEELLKDSRLPIQDKTVVKTQPK
jgi:hypothetical protein